MSEWHDAVFDDNERTSYSVISTVFWTDSAISISVEACHGLLGEEGEGFLEDCMRRISADSSWNFM